MELDVDTGDQHDQATKNLIHEMEKALNVAAQTVTRQEADLEKERYKSSQLENDWEAVKLNNILISRHDKLIDYMQSLNRIAVKRNSESAQVMKTQGEAAQKLMKDHESRTEGHSRLIRE